MAKSDAKPDEDVPADNPPEDQPEHDPEAVAESDAEVDQSIDHIDPVDEEHDAHAEMRADLQEAHDSETAALDEAHRRAMAMIAPVKKVIDGNETAALRTISGWKPLRDESEAPEPQPLGAHNRGMPTTEDTPVPEPAE